MINNLIWNGTFKGRFLEKDYALEVFHRHNEDVKAKVPADRLLVYEIKQGWEPLCEFLGVDVPRHADAPPERHGVVPQHVRDAGAGVVRERPQRQPAAAGTDSISVNWRNCS